MPQISSYDPLGILSPITLRSKILMQSLSQRKYEWDEPLPHDVTSDWASIRDDMGKAAETEIPRCYLRPITDTPNDKVLHVFRDRSIKAYGAFAYIVSGNESSLVMARNRVVPLRTMTIPKLELMSALVGARLCDHVLSNLQCIRAYLWSDSQIVLNWLSSEKTTTTFVKNRVKNIRELTSNHQWRYCPTETNLAAILSRGMSYDKFKDSNLWMHGPAWITDEEWPIWSSADRTFTPTDDRTCIPTDETARDTDDRQNSSATVASITTDEPSVGIARVIDLERFSQYKKLLRVTAYVLRFISNCRHQNKTDALSNAEINAVALEWIRSTQHTSYPNVSLSLQKDSSKKPNLVRQLNLYLDEQNRLRCRGRIHNAPLDDDAKFPYM